MLRGVIFDMDGVLVDSARAHIEAWRRLGEELGHPFTDQHFAATFGMHNNQILPLWLGRPVDPDEGERLASRKEEMFRRLVPETMQELRGSQALVKALKDEGLKLAVGSSGPFANVDLILKQLGIREHFDALSTGDDVVHGKPDPEVFLVAARKLAVEPAACLVIEDAPQGVEAARRAGMTVVAVTSSRPVDALKEADLVVDSLEELTPAQLRSLFQAT